MYFLIFFFIQSAVVAKQLAEDSFALIFGINTLMALVFQTIMTVVIVSETGFGLDPRGQFLVFGGYFVGLSILFLLASLIQVVFCKRKQENLTIN